MPHLATALLSGALISFLPVMSTQAIAAQADPWGAYSSLKLSVTETPVTSEDGEISAYKAVTLHCDPPRGDHPRAAEACEQLNSRDGFISILDPNAVCTLEYAPRTARVVGRWKGRPVGFSRLFTNDCQLKAATGALFAF